MAMPAQQTIRQLQRLIARYQPCHILTQKNIRYDDIWLRDILPLWSTEDRAIRSDALTNPRNWQGWLPRFDGWGGVQSCYQQDADLAARLFHGQQLRCSNLVGEGGCFSHNGEWLLVGLQCLRKRNPTLPPATLKNQLSEQLSPLKPVFIEASLSADETQGHVDNMAVFVADDVLLYAYTDDPGHPDFDSCRQLQEQVQQLPASIKKIALPLPMPQWASASERQQIQVRDGALARTQQLPLLFSYVNQIAMGNVLIVPQYDIAEDQQVLVILQEALPGYQLQPFKARELVLGGGGLHCVSAQLPRALLSSSPALLV